MFKRKTVESISQQFTIMVNDLEDIIDDVTNGILEIDSEIGVLLNSKEKANNEMKRAMKFRSNLSTLIGE